MYIFIPRIKVSISQNSLHDFCAVLLNTKLQIPFTEIPRLLSCDIVEIRQENGCIEHHGLVCIQPEQAAKWFIKAINKKGLGKKKIKARPYVARQREYPETSRGFAALAYPEDRRRPNLIISKVKDETTVIVREGLAISAVNSP